MGKCHFLCALWYRHPTPPAAVFPMECGMALGDGLDPRMMFSTCLSHLLGCTPVPPGLCAAAQVVFPALLWPDLTHPILLSDSFLPV